MVLKGITLCVSVFVCFSNCFEETIKQTILDSLSELCPYNDFCRKNSIMNISVDNLGPCCIPCSCDEACRELETCCPDKIDTSDAYQSFQSACKNIIIKKAPGDETPSWGIGYRVLDDCPAAEADTDLAFKCRTPNISDLRSVIWVSDTNAGQVFQNQYCAECNGIKQVTYWQVETQCGSASFDMSSPASVLKEDDCTFLLHMPVNMRLLTEKYQCFIPQIEQCNETGLWIHYDETIETGCNTYSMPFLSEYAGGELRSIFKNAFCYMCNVDSFIPKQHMCSKTSEKSGNTKFSLIIDFTSFINDQDKKYRCKIDEIYDPYLVIKFTTDIKHPESRENTSL